jgi:hypothetical protein
MAEISKYNELIDARGEGVGASTEEDRYLGYLQNQIDQFYAQRGMENPNATMPMQTQQMNRPESFSFNTPEEAEEAKRNNILKVGDKVIIGGKTYITE